MQGRMVFALLLLCALPARAEIHQNLSLGLGMPYGGLGGKYSVTRDSISIYGSLGLMYYSTEHGARPGFGVGFDHQIMDSRHSLGLSLSTLGVLTRTYIFEDRQEARNVVGPVLHYQFHFGGFARRGWVLGGSAGAGKVHEGDTTFSGGWRTGTWFNVGYRF